MIFFLGGYIFIQSSHNSRCVIENNNSFNVVTFSWHGYFVWVLIGLKGQCWFALMINIGFIYLLLIERLAPFLH